MIYIKRMQTFILGAKMQKYAPQADRIKIKLSVDNDAISHPPVYQKRLAWDVEKSCKPPQILAYLQASASVVANTRILYVSHPQRLPV